MGDYLVRTFTSPARVRITVTERVIAVKDKSVFLEVTRDAGQKNRTIRVELDDTPEHRGEIISTSVVRDGIEIAMGRAAYDAVMSGTAFSVDENEGQIESENTKIDVHGRAVDCTETSFRVKVHGKDATMKTVELLNSPQGRGRGRGENGRRRCALSRRGH